MCTPALRLWLPAILTLTLGLVQGRACGQEGIGTAIAAAMRHMAKQRSVLPPLSAPVSPPRVALFAWEKDDRAEWEYNVGRFNEAVGDHEEAYIHFRGLCRDHAAERRYSEATERVKGRALVDLTKKGLIGGRCLWNPNDPCFPKRNIEEWEAENWRLTDISKPVQQPLWSDILPDTEISRVVTDFGARDGWFAIPTDGDSSKDPPKDSLQRNLEGFHTGPGGRF